MDKKLTEAGGANGGVFVAYGYRHDEVDLPRPGEIKDGTDIVINRTAKDIYLGSRPPVAVSAGCHVQGALPGHVDPLDPDSTIAGTQKRFVTKPPRPVKRLLVRLKRYVRQQLESGRFGDPIMPDEDISFENWIDNVDYPEWRKAQLRTTWAELIDISEDPRNFHNKSFMKDEHYTDWKHARGINSRSDAFKCFSGPIFRLIEKRVFNAPEFIKKVPVNERADYIYNRLFAPGCSYFTSDYSSFEALFTSEVMDAVEFEMYEYFTRMIPDSWLTTITATLSGVNLCKFKHFVVRVLATRMSGEMCTSLGNGFSNLMFMEFACSVLGSECIGVVEGDDGLFSIKGTVPTADDFSKLGLIIKCEVHDRLETASFCGIVFEETDRVNVTDPHKVIAMTGWLTGRYAASRPGQKMDLLRCKGLSLIYQYPRCPIILALGRYILRVTRGRDLRGVLENRNLNSYEREWLKKIVASEKELKLQALACDQVPERTRHLVERLYGISRGVQVAVEEYLDSLTEICPLVPPGMTFPESWCTYFSTYCRQVLKGQRFDPVDCWYNLRSPGSIDRARFREEDRGSPEKTG